MLGAMSRYSRISVMTFRSRMFQALAQAATKAPTPTISGRPTQVIVSSLFPSVITGWGANNLAYIQGIVNALNNALFYLSNGELDFNKLRLVSFQSDPSGIPDQYLLAVVRFAKTIFDTMLMNGANIFKAPITPQDKGARILRLETALSSSNIPDGSINPQLTTHIGGNLKTILTNTLHNIK